MTKGSPPILTLDDITNLHEITKMKEELLQPVGREQSGEMTAFFFYYYGYQLLFCLIPVMLRY